MIWRNIATDPTEEKTRTFNDLAYNEPGSDTWISVKSVQNMINVFKIFRYRRMLRISWTEHITNDEAFNMAKTKTTLLD